MIYQPKALPEVGQKRLDAFGRIVEANGYTYTYDDKGRLTQKQSTDLTVDYTYDSLDRLITVSMDNQQINYTYDILGRRLSKTKFSHGEIQKEFYLYQGVNQIGVYDEDKNPIHLRILGEHAHSHLPQAITIESNGKVYYPTYSSSFNIIQLRDRETKETVTYENLGLFGENLSELNLVCPWVFATKPYDPDTGLIDFGARQYDPSIKQWTSADPDPRAIGDEIYSYCNNNPLKYSDPDGKWVIFIPLTEGLWAATAAILTGLGCIAAKKGVDHINEGSKPRRDKKNKPRMDNDVKNPQYDDAGKEIEKQLGRKLNDKEWRQFHDHVTGQGYDYHDMVNEGYHLFDNSYKNK